jgi:hypothetical protein
VASNAQITASIIANVEPTAIVGNPGGSDDRLKFGGTPITMALGTAAGQFNELWGDARDYTTTPTILALDALAAALSNYGKASVFTNVRFLMLANLATTGNLVWMSTTGGAPSNPFLGMLGAAVVVTIPPKGFVLLGAPDLGHAVSTAKNIKLEASAGTVRGYVGLIGLK